MSPLQPRISVTIRPMQPADAPELLRLMQALVTFERGTGFALTEADLLRWGFGEQPLFGAFVAEAGQGSLAGMAVHYTIPFMHNGRPRLMMKWLYVDPNTRGAGVGKRLMQAMARYATDHGFPDFRWFVLKDNDPAQRFYRSLGAEPDPTWDYWTYPADALANLAAG